MLQFQYTDNSTANIEKELSKHIQVWCILNGTMVNNKYYFSTQSRLVKMVSHQTLNKVMSSELEYNRVVV